jgi:multiple antibiotic resistance protein
MKEFRLCFVPLFVAVDVIGVLPAFHSMNQDMEPRQVPPAISRSVATAEAVVLAFLALGHRRPRSPYPSYATTR